MAGRGAAVAELRQPANPEAAKPKPPETNEPIATNQTLPGIIEQVDGAVTNKSLARRILETIKGGKVAEQSAQMQGAGVEAAIKERKKHSQRKEKKVVDKFSEQQKKKQQENEEILKKLQASDDPQERAAGYDLEKGQLQHEIHERQKLITAEEKSIEDGKVAGQEAENSRAGIEKTRQEIDGFRAKIKQIDLERATIVDKDGAPIGDQMRDAAKVLAKDLAEQEQNPDIASQILQQAETGDPYEFIFDRIFNMTDQQSYAIAEQYKAVTNKELEKAPVKKYGLLALIIMAFITYSAAKKASKETNQGHGGMMG